MKRLMSVLLAAALIAGLSLTPAGADSSRASRMEYAALRASQRFVWQQPRPQGNEIKAVDFVDGSYTLGWAVGANGTVIKTTDGGGSWAQQGPVAPQGAESYVSDASDVDFVSATTGYVAMGPQILKTTNGGDSWTSTNAWLTDMGGTYLNYTSVDFFDASNGWAVANGLVFRTSNGGSTWAQQTLPPSAYARKVIAFSAANAYAQVSGSGYLETTDGGVTWSARTFTGTAYEDYPVFDLVGRGGYLFAAAGTHILRSSSYGSTWTTTTVGLVDGDYVYRMAVSDDDPSAAVAFTDAGHVFWTGNGGVTPWEHKGSLGTSYPRSPDFSGGRMFVVGDHVMVSADTGSNWSTLGDFATDDAFVAVDFTSETTGAAITASEYAWTSDGGTTWGITDLSATGVMMNDLFFLQSDPLVGWIVGDSVAGAPKVLKTTNGGATWQSQPETTMAASRVCFADADNGWATNNSWGAFWHSADGGASWTRIMRPGWFWDVDFVDANTGWIALDADDGKLSVLRTLDGGSTWTTQTVGSSGGTVQELDFADANNGWCADTFGTVYRTTNGGATWTELSGSPGSLVDITDIAFTSPTEGWIVGEQTTASFVPSYRHDFAAYTADGGVTWDYRTDPAGTDEGSTGSAVRVNAVDSAGGASCWIVGGGGSILHAPKPSVCVRTSGSKTLGTYGMTYTFTGRLELAGVGVPGKRVVLQSGTSTGAFSDTSVVATTATDGSFSMTVKPSSATYYRARFPGDATTPGSRPSGYAKVVPSPWVGNPVAPATMYKSRYYTVAGYLKPRHTAGTYPVRIYLYRYSNGAYRYYGSVAAKAYNYSTYTKYVRSVRLPYTGKWRLRTYAPADSGHAAEWSTGFDYVTVR